MARERFSNEQIIESSIREFRTRLLPQVQTKFDSVVNDLRNYLHNNAPHSHFDAPNSRKWFTIKSSPRKAIIAFRSVDGAIEFDIDTRNITVDRRLFRETPNRQKPNKVYVALIDVQTTTTQLNYFIQKMREAIDVFAA